MHHQTLQLLINITLVINFQNILIIYFKIEKTKLYLLSHVHDVQTNLDVFVSNLNKQTLY